MEEDYPLRNYLKVDSPREDFAPMPPFGWKTVARKTRKSEQVMKGEDKKAPLRLIEKDWDVKILTREEIIKPRVEGVLQASDEQACDLVFFLQKQNLRMVLVTPNKCNDQSIKFECRVLAVNDRITKIQRWYTNIGHVLTAPNYVAAGSDTPKINIANSTAKIVLQLVRKYTSNKEWTMATGNPGAALRDWINEAGATSRKGGAHWIEQVLILKADGAKKVNVESGHKGVFCPSQ